MIPIDRDAMQQTKQICHHELDVIQSKYERHPITLVWSFLAKELKTNICFAVLGLIATLCVSMILYEWRMLCIVVYFLILGCAAILEYVKNHIYDMNELLTVSYINSGRRFLLQTISISIIQLLCFLMICLIIPLDQKEFIHVVIRTIIPIYLSQMLALSFFSYIHNTVSCFLIYILSYLLILIGIEYFEMIRYMSLWITQLGIVFVIGFYFMTIITLYYQRKGKNNYGTHY